MLLTLTGCSDVASTPQVAMVPVAPRSLPNAIPVVHAVGSPSAAKPTADKPANNQVAQESGKANDDKSDKQPDKPAPSKSNPGEVIPISFDDININMQQDIVYRPWMLTDRAKELDGKRVTLKGYFHAGVSQAKNIKQFVLLKNKECKFGPGGQADHLVQVHLQGKASTSYSLDPVQVEGVLKLNPYQGPDGNTWSVFDLLGDLVKPAKK
jgi:hypothetical protein